MGEANFPHVSTTGNPAAATAGETQARGFPAALAISAMLVVLAALQISTASTHWLQQLLYLGYFVPIALGARYLSRRLSFLATGVAATVYMLAFIPDYATLATGRGSMLVEVIGHAALFSTAGIFMTLLRHGFVREQERALKSERERSEKLKLMLEVSTMVASSLRIEQVLQMLATRIVETVGATFCRIALLDDRGDNLRVVAAQPAHRSERLAAIGMTIPLSELPEHQRVIQAHEAVIVGGRRQEQPPLSKRQEELMDGAKSLLLYPLVVAGEAVGIVCIGEQRSWDRSPISQEKSNLCQTIVNQAAVAVGHAISHQELEDAFVGTIRSLAEAIDAKDPSTRGHSDWVAKYALMIGRQAGLKKSELDVLTYAGYLHDVGKIGIPDEILGKTSQLSRDEWKQMRKHPIVSAKILDPVRLSPKVKAAIRHHHERYDGKGYPYGLAGESIPVEARILAVADAYEAMTSDRPYRKALSDEQAVAELVRCAGTQFDPVVVDYFLRALGRSGLGAEEVAAGSEEMAG